MRQFCGTLIGSFLDTYINFPFLRDNYNMLLTPQLEPFPPYTPKHFMHGEVPIQLQALFYHEKSALQLILHGALICYHHSLLYQKKKKNSNIQGSLM